MARNANKFKTVGAAFGAFGGRQEDAVQRSARTVDDKRKYLIQSQVSRL
jgi:hypothetical protein